MYNLEKEIEKFLSEPLQVGDSVTVRGLGRQNKTDWGNSTDVIKINDDLSIVVREYNSNITVKKEDYKRGFHHIGKDPFKKVFRINSFSVNIAHLLHVIGFDKKNDGKIAPNELNWSPHVIINGEKHVFQRGFVWKLEDKKALIDSIYNRRDIGKFLIKVNSIDTTCDLLDNNKEAYFREIIDGKQRLNAILEFVQNKFTDHYGNYFKDLSANAKHKFRDYMNFSYAEIDHKATDEDILDIFLMVNHSGKQMSKVHLDKVSNLRRQISHII